MHGKKGQFQGKISRTICWIHRRKLITCYGHTNKGQHFMQQHVRLRSQGCEPGVCRRGESRQSARRMLFLALHMQYLHLLHRLYVDLHDLRDEAQSISPTTVDPDLDT